ncbi:MAG: hypothetical protein NUV76_01635 [Candidatus Kuenenia sp.]|nr:hypothetical protein [Candidatus Kuenenia sp.]
MRKCAAIEKIGREMETLPVSALRELKGFIKTLKIKKNTKEVHKKKPYSVFDKIEESAMDVGIEDWARNHDHYLYGTDKR